MPLLHNGETFTQLSIPKIGGGMLSLPDDLKGSFGVVLIYRGAWCPYCNAQLSGFERASAKLAEIGVKVAAFSVDDEATTAALVAKHGIRYPVGFGADARTVAARLGSYINEEPLYLQTTGFVLAPDGSVVNAVYSSGAIGRLVADDVVGLVAYLKSNTR
ncbi:MAG: redoxin domain-containing protein [Methylovirgula sp.]